MAVTIDKIPVYDALILDETSGMMKISLVDDPAVMSNFQAFDSEKKLLMYEVEDDEKRLVRGVVMRADFPIYRRDKTLGEYYIIYKADTIRQMAEKYLVENRQNNFNTMHEEGSDVEGIQMVQFFIKDTAAGIAPASFDEIADGSLFGEFHVTNDEVWDEIKKGTYKGFSLEGYFDLVPDDDEEKVKEIVDGLDGKFSKSTNNTTMSKFAKIKAAILKAFAELASITTDKGVLSWDGDEEVKVGDSVFIVDEDDNRNPAPDDDYKTSEGKVIKVVDGKVSEIVDPDTTPEDKTEKFGVVSTDKGDLSWEGEDALKEGDAVFVEKDGERVAAEDGEYVTDDNKVIKVTEGKVESITEKVVEVSEKERKQNFLRKIREAFSESYQKLERRICEALRATLAEGVYSYLVDAGEGYAIFNIFSEDNWEGKYYRYEVSFNEAGEAVLGNREEVKPAFVPVNEPNPSSPSEEEFNRLKEENDALRAENEELKKTPAAQPAHEDFNVVSLPKSTGDVKLDRLARAAALVRQAREAKKA